MANAYEEDRVNVVVQRISLAFSLLLAAGTLRAEEIPEHFTPVRPAGMGGAYTAVAHDDASIWTNPAGIARVRKARSRGAFHLTRFPNFIAGANTSGQSFYTGFQAAQDKNIEAIVAEVGDLGDKPFWARAAMFPVTLFDVQRGSPMAFGIYSNTKAKAIIEEASPESARIEAVSDAGGVITYAWTNKTNRFNFGVQVRPILRYAYEDRIPSVDLLNKDTMKDRLESDSNTSQGLGVDVGMMYTIADFWFPTIGISVLNLPTGCRDNYLNPFTEARETVCGTAYSGSFGNEDALSTVDPTDIRVGIAITPRLSRKIAMRFALDAHHLAYAAGDQIYGLQGIEASKLVHAGVEFFVGNPMLLPPVAVRAGYNQGFVTMGATLNLNYISLEFATYGIDVSSTEKPVEDRRMLASISVDF